MAQRALHILSSESTLAMFSQQALEAAHRFSMEQIGQAYLDLYTSLLHGEQAHR